ncbi:AGE family epimerase/isomerase [Natrinema salaciae]|uniref:Mannose or cellobiose epimerase, N-acyl-D-glucosamine 2-epimerase family n=1 Tax=Natrinema salaciae TaxID=1186196 RepID=A0A1H9BUB1_9EURY|nr:AGE family epimerase/isomerase [Natrinema salaciae]SEP92576.1 Mannose or cellobiose epimerase, N-acyl-D-glucosamine 2-epimerase family [Natrinema salaciae]
MTVYRTRAGLRHRFRDVLNFYYPDCLDTTVGGYVAQLDERDGHVYDARTKHLVATARGVHNFSLGVLADGPHWCEHAAEHGLQFLATVHWDDARRGYDWHLDGRTPTDRTRYCYGHAFVLLAAARALQAGIAGARDELERAFGVLEERFWELDHGRYAARASPDWELAPYRGQNANMHACEALLAAYEATGADRFLERAYTVADRVTRDGTAATDGLLWEHYTESWEPDLSYNEDSPRHQFRPPGYQPGHHAEWAKLLALLAEHRPEDWLLERARTLFDAAVDLGWDDEHGGLYYTVADDGEPIVADKYGWVHAEAIGASALLSRVDRDADGRSADVLEWYDRLWEYAGTHLINPRYGNWYERVTREHDRDGPNHGPAVEPGYHPLTNCWLVTRALAADGVDALGTRADAG